MEELDTNRTGYSSETRPEASLHPPRPAAPQRPQPGHPLPCSTLGASCFPSALQTPRPHSATPQSPSAPPPTLTRKPEVLSSKQRTRQTKQRVRKAEYSAGEPAPSSWARRSLPSAASSAARGVGTARPGGRDRDERRPPRSPPSALEPAPPAARGTRGRGAWGGWGFPAGLRPPRERESRYPCGLRSADTVGDASRPVNRMWPQGLPGRLPRGPGCAKPAPWPSTGQPPTRGRAGTAAGPSGEGARGTAFRLQAEGTRAGASPRSVLLSPAAADPPASERRGRPSAACGGSMAQWSCRRKSWRSSTWI